MCAKPRSGGRGGRGLSRLNWFVGSWMIDSIILIDETPSLRLLLTAIVYVVTV